MTLSSAFIRLLRCLALPLVCRVQRFGNALFAGLLAGTPKIAPLPPYKQGASNEQTQNLDKLE
jgi:hypothetical protein